MKTVTLRFKPVHIQTVGDSPDELLQNARNIFNEQMHSEQLEVHSYSVSAAAPANIDTVYAGQVVESLDGVPGIVYEVNKQMINVSLANGQLVSGSPVLFKPSDCAFKKVRKSRNAEDKQHEVWTAGVAGYIMTDFGPAPVIIGKGLRDKVIVHFVGEKKSKKLTRDEAGRFIRDEPYHFT
ncbi:hypothetical protein [Planococcus alpniumensis]|uniref:hypothetical protein n=1 Tax=Planococcus alpniumensis TaxID=2708345 RepID=UPI001B8C2F76|nr:hypothetical protein [Planococcus sp. MSAK28401]